MNIKPEIASIAIINAARSASEKRSISKPGTIAAVTFIIKALINNAKIPKVITVSGSVNIHRSGRINAFIIPSTNAAIIRSPVDLALIPGTRKITSQSPIAVINQMSNKPKIIRTLLMRPSIGVVYSLDSNLCDSWYICLYLFLNITRGLCTIESQVKMAKISLLFVRKLVNI